MKVKSLSRIQPSATPWTAAYQAPLSMGFSRQEYWSGLPLLLQHTLKKLILWAHLCMHVICVRRIVFSLCFVACLSYI